MQRVFLILVLLAGTAGVFAQDTTKTKKQERRQRINNLIVREEEEGVIVYKKQFVGGAKLTNDGYGGFLEWGRAKSIKTSILYQFEILEQKSPKEVKIVNQLFPVSSFVYGKENFLYPVKLGVQKQKLLGNKSNKNGVSITGNYGGGLLLGILRPYYVQLQDGSYIKYDSDSASKSTFINNPDSIIGGPTFSKGWSEITVTPGIYVKTSLRFDYGIYNELVSALEIGLSAEYYTKNIPIMALSEQKKFFLQAYVAILFGKRK